MITIDDFAKVEMRVGEVVEATEVIKSTKLIKLIVNFGDETRIIFTAVRTYGYTPEDFLNKKFLFVTNLEYKKIMDEESQGMILAVDSSASSEQVSKPVFVTAGRLPVGAKVR